MGVGFDPGYQLIHWILIMECRDTAPKRRWFVLAVGADNRIAVPELNQGHGTEATLVSEPWQLIDAVVAKTLVGRA